MDNKKPSKRKVVDWEAIEPDWRAGVKTKLQLSKEHGVSRAAIDKYFNGLGIERNLNAKIQAKAEALVTQSQVTQQVTLLDKVTESEIVNVNATKVATVLITHRSDISRFRNLVFNMMQELEVTTDNRELFRELFSELGELLYKPDDKGVDKLNELYHKVISLPSRVDSIKKLSEALKTLIGLEREAFNIGTLPPDGGTNLPSSINPNESFELMMVRIKQDIQKFTIVQS